MTDKTTKAFNWHIAIDETYRELTRQIIDYAPQLIGAVALLIIGWIVAHFLRLSARKIVEGFDSLFKKASKDDSGKEDRIKHSYTLIVSQVVFWAVLLFFIAAISNLLGWKMFSGWMDNIVSFLPSLISGLLIILIGYLASNAVHFGIVTTGKNAEIPHAELLARTAQIAILFSCAIIGVEQIGLNVSFLTNFIMVVFGILLAGAALAFSFGAQTMVANILGTQVIRKYYQAGETIRFAEYEGEILEITETSVVLDTQEGRMMIPSKLLQEQISIVSAISSSPELATDAVQDSESDRNE